MTEIYVPLYEIRNMEKLHPLTESAAIQEYVPTRMREMVPLADRASHIIFREIYALRPRVVTLQGFPIRAYPDWNNGYQAWHTLAFQESWKFIDRLYKGIQIAHPSIDLQHHVLLDDQFHGEDGTVGQRPNANSVPDDEFLSQTIEAVQSEFYHPPPILSQLDAWHLAGAIVAKYGKRNRDLHVQFAKLTYAVEKGYYPSMLNIVVLPITYQERALRMFHDLSLFISMQNDVPVLKGHDIGQIRTVAGSFRNVWINECGDPQSVTQPLFVEGTYEHIKIRQ